MGIFLYLFVICSKGCSKLCCNCKGMITCTIPYSIIKLESYIGQSISESNNQTPNYEKWEYVPGPMLELFKFIVDLVCFEKIKAFSVFLFPKICLPIEAKFVW